MQSLQEILGGKDFVPPSEIELIKAYVKRRYNSACRVQVRKNDIVIGVRSSALAGTLRLEQQRLIEECRLDKKLVFRIG